MDTPPPAPPATSAAALGDYVLGERLERRAAADVYAARHTPTGAPRVLYVLRPGAMQDAPLIHRVVHEADSAHWLRHPAAARVEAYGETPSRRLYVAVERPAGRTLAAVLAERGALRPATLVRLAYRLVEALDEAHGLGLVHGHLTPASVVVADALGATPAGDAPLVTLTGLGVAAAAHGLGAPVEPAAGDPYAAPERLVEGEADARADVYALAALLHHALVGTPPDRSAVVKTHGTPHVRAVAVLAAARAADPAARPAGVKALWDDFLAALVAGESLVFLEEAVVPAVVPAATPVAEVARAVAVAVAPVATSETTAEAALAPAARLATPPSVRAAARPAPRRRRLIWEPVAAGVGLLVIGLSLAHGTVLRAGLPAGALPGAVRPTFGGAPSASAVNAASPGAGEAAPRTSAVAPRGGSGAPRQRGGGSRGGRGRESVDRVRETAPAEPTAVAAAAADKPADAPAIAVPSIIVLQVSTPQPQPTPAPTRPGEFKPGSFSEPH